jgi:hypothetical protein
MGRFFLSITPFATMMGDTSRRHSLDAFRPYYPITPTPICHV